LTDAVIRLWLRLKGKQISNVQFYRQKPIGEYIVDFYAPKVKLVIELDGSQHFSESGFQRDSKRDDYLTSLCLQVLRFDNLQLLKETDGALAVISQVVESRIRKIPLPPFPKGESIVVANHQR
jgi:very-short-patch-repair endonuclease